MRPDGICWFPVTPYPTRSMMFEKNGFPARKGSWDSRHPTLNAGKVPHW